MNELHADMLYFRIVKNSRGNYTKYELDCKPLKLINV